MSAVICRSTPLVIGFLFPCLGSPDGFESNNMWISQSISSDKESAMNSRFEINASLIAEIKAVYDRYLLEVRKWK